MAQRPTRRRLLGLGIVGAGVLAAGGGAWRWLTGGYGDRIPSEHRPVFLELREMAIVEAFVRAVLPEDGAFPSGESIAIALRFDEEAWAAPAPVSRDLRAAIELVEVAPLLSGYGGRLTRLEPERARAFVEEALDSPSTTLQRAVSGLRQLALLQYYAHEATRAATGYEGPWVGQPVPSESRARYEGWRRRA